MSSSQSFKAWDLSPVLELVNALSIGDVSLDGNKEARTPPKAAETRDVHDEEYAQAKESQSVGLGDFGRIWQFLGVAFSGPQEQGSVSDGGKPQHFSSKNDYASDGAVSYGLHTRTSKTVTWRDDTSIDDIAPSSSPEREMLLTADSAKLTKSQRKKKNKRQRKAKETASTSWIVSESEADNVLMQTPARKASVHGNIVVPNSRYNLRTRDRLDQVKEFDSVASATLTNVSKPERPGETVRQTSQPDLLSAKNENHSSRPAKIPGTSQWPVVATKESVPTTFLPSSVLPRRTTKQPTSTSKDSFPEETSQAIRAVQMATSQLQASTPSKSLPVRTSLIEPKVVRSGEDRHWALLLKLINEFQQDRKHLVSPMAMTSHNNDPSGIHLFVDASNIFIGFNDQLKRSRDIPLNVRVPPVDLSFDALALLLERRRPVAKRTLVGSTPHLPAFDKAKAVGYECSILEKVYKARELTDRQIFFKERESREGRAKARTTRDSDGGGYSSGGGYTSETGTGAAERQYAPARLIEQGVDELLHMKMAQSLLDYETPATMVVATGDAAQAEYSDGFKAMIERALRKGWTVELVSWSKNISSLYLRKDFRMLWGTRFKVIYLDDYAEELLDM